MSYPPRVAILHSLPHPQALADIIQREYGFNHVEDCKLLRAGQNDTYYIWAGGERSIARLYRSGSDLESILYEFDVLDKLKRGRVKASSPRVAHDGNRVVEVSFPEGIRYLGLFDYAEGMSMSRTPRDAFFYGRAMASLHQAMEGFSSAHTRITLDLEELVDRPLGLLSIILMPKPDALAFLTSYFADIKVRLSSFESSHSMSFCHGDLHGGNARIDDDSVVTLYDFDSCGPGWSIYDLAVYRWESWMDECPTKVWSNFLDGYITTRVISHEEMNVIPLFAAVRCLWAMSLSLGGGDIWGYGDIGDGYVDNQLNALAEWSELSFG